MKASIKNNHIFNFRNIIILFLLMTIGCMKNREKKAKFIDKDKPSYLHIKGHDIVDGNGDKIFLKGVGLGNWLLPEGYMWKFEKKGDRPRKIEKMIKNLIGEENANKFWQEFRKNYITETDIKRISELGFNSVRPALNARLFLTEDDNPVFIEENFQLLDNLVKWCKKYNIYVIIDMHGAPGGQTGANIDDSPNDKPELFMDKKFEDRLTKLWIRIVETYKNEPTIIAYDLLNEPLPKHYESGKFNNQLEPLYKRLTETIRKIDKNHMITLEGANWANDWSVFSKPFDDNTFYQFHYYCWDNPKILLSIDQYLKKRKEFNTPLWVGETGENNNTLFWGATQLLETNNIGWSFWPWKKMATKNTPYSIKMPDNWEQIIEYSKKDGKKPSTEIAQKAFDDLLENIKLQNCEFFQDVINVIFRQLPAKVEAENYGHKGYNNSYFVTDTTQRSEFYRLSEPVFIGIIENKENPKESEFYATLKANEWLIYNINSSETKHYNATLDIKAESNNCSIIISLNEQIQEIKITNTDWQKINTTPIKFHNGLNDLKIKAINGSVNINYINFKE